MQRRQVVKWLGIGTLGAAAAVTGRRVLLPPARSTSLDSVDHLATRLVDSFDEETRAVACVEYDHPLRQYHNRGVSLGGASGRSLSWDQRQILTDLLYAGLSEQGQTRIPDEMNLNWYRRVHALDVFVCGDPRKPPYQLMISGPHVNLRLGGRNREGVAFGGPQVYGDQQGHGRQGLPGNLYRYQFQTAHRLFQSLTLDQQRQAVLPTSPIQTQIELAGRDASFPGVSIATLKQDSRKIARELVDEILSTYAADDVAYAAQCLDRNGGVEALSLSYYEDGDVRGSGQYQIFRMEGPARSSTFAAIHTCTRSSTLR